MALSNLRRFKARTIALVFPMALMMTVCSFMMFSRGGFIKDAQTAVAFLPDITVQHLEAGRVSKISLNTKARIEKMPHVKTVLPRVWGYIPLRINGVDTSYTLMGIDIDHLKRGLDILPEIKAGCFLAPGDRKKAVLGDGVAKTLGVDVEDGISIKSSRLNWIKDSPPTHAHENTAGTFGGGGGESAAKPFDLNEHPKKIGDSIELKDTLGNRGEFKIIGIFNNQVQIYSTDLIVVSNDDARQFFDYRKDEASDLLIYLSDHANADRVAMTITQELRNVRVLTRKVLTELTREAFGRRGGTFMAMWLILLSVVLVLVWAQLSHIGADMGKEVGTLKAVGWSAGDIIEMKMVESLVCGLMGTLTGILTGFCYALMGTPGISGYCLGCATIYPKFPAPISCDLADILLLFVLGVMPITVASAIPAWMAGVIEPDECIRG
jgi:ABC-type lipoprotein release transport system permease subunit